MRLCQLEACGLRHGAAALVTVAVLVAGLAAPAHAAGPAFPDRTAWAQLSPAQQQALSPLQREWSSLEPTRKQKWLEVAARFPSIPPDERQRVQARMADWARLTPAERAQARLQYQEVSQLPADERRARWQAYQALSEDERQKLAQQGKAPPAGLAGTMSGAARSTPAPDGQARSRGAASAVPDNAKRNLVQPTTVSATRSNAPRVIAPVVTQAKPGATTTTMSVRAATPPAHTQPGLPKIAATPGYVDSATLLPRRGPQGAAARPAAADTSADRPAD